MVMGDFGSPAAACWALGNCMERWDWCTKLLVTMKNSNSTSTISTIEITLISGSSLTRGRRFIFQFHWL
jgi:hypothetical protein